jgi:hypothetical protein
MSMNWNQHYQDIYTTANGDEYSAVVTNNDAHHVVGNVSDDEEEEQPNSEEHTTNTEYDNELPMHNDTSQHPADEDEDAGSIRDVAVFDDNWGAMDNNVDSYCFLCQRGETKEEMSKNKHFCRLIELTRCQLGVSDIKRCRLIQKLYQNKFMGNHVNNKPWSLHSIKRHIYEHDANVEVVSEFVTNIIASQMVRMSETCLCTQQGERGQKMVNLEAMDKFMKMAKSFFDIKKKNAL